MTVGEKIKFIRNFRGMTQKELGVGIGFDEKGADNRIAQYETNYRVTFFWLDEDNPGAINLFQLVRNPGKCNASDDTAVRYNDSDDWPAHPPVGLWFKYGVVDDFMREWLVRKNELKTGEITREEYLEWKLNWPDTCDGCGIYNTKKRWRKI